MAQQKGVGVKLLEAIRTKTGWNKQTIAERLGVTLMTLYRWENGENEPSPLALQKLRDLLKQVS